MKVNDTEKCGTTCRKKDLQTERPQKGTAEALVRTERHSHSQGKTGYIDGKQSYSAPGSYNRQYQDRLFKAIFGREEHKDWLLSLYNALNVSSYTYPSDIDINTIEGIIYVTMKNDISFLIDSQLNLYEHKKRNLKRSFANAKLQGVGKTTYV